MQLAARIAVSNLHKNTLKSFSETCALSLLALLVCPSPCCEQSSRGIKGPAVPQMCAATGSS